MITSERLLLLLTRDDGTVMSQSTAGYGFAAANIADLVAEGRIVLSDEKAPRLTVLDPTPTGNRALDAALTRLADKDGAKLAGLVTDRAVAATDEVAASLAETGAIEIEEKKLLGLVPARYPVRDPRPEQELRARLRAALDGGAVEPGDAVLLAVVRGLDVGHKVFKDEWGGSRRDLKRRLDEIGTGTSLAPQVGDAVRRAVEAAAAAATAAIVGATSASADSSGD